MQPRDTLEPGRIDGAQLGRRAAVGEHRPLAAGLDDHDDATGAPGPLHPHVDADGGERGHHGHPGGVVADPTHEPRRAPGGDGRGGDVGGAARLASADHRSGVRTAGRCSHRVDDDVLDEVAHDAQHEDLVSPAGDRDQVQRSGNRGLGVHGRCGRRPCTLRASMGRMGGTGDTDTAVALAAELLTRSAAGTTRSERRRADRLGRLLADDAGRALLFALTDEVLRTPTAGRSMAQLRELVGRGLPIVTPPPRPHRPAPGRDRLDDGARPGRRHRPPPDPRRDPRRRHPGRRSGLRPPRRRQDDGGLRPQHQPPRRGDPRRRRGGRSPRRPVRADPSARRHVRVGEDLGAVRRPRRARLRARGRPDRRSPPGRLRRRRGAVPRPSS